MDDSGPVENRGLSRCIIVVVIVIVKGGGIVCTEALDIFEGRAVE